MKRLLAFIVLVMISAGVVSCGTFQVGVEGNSTGAPSPTAQPSPTPGPATPVTVKVPTLPGVPTASATAARATVIPQRISFAPGASTFSFNTDLSSDVPRAYILSVLGGQTMTVKANANVSIAVTDVVSNPVNGTAIPGQWQGTLPQTADYVILLRGEGLTSVTITIPPPGS